MIPVTVAGPFLLHSGGVPPVPCPSPDPRSFRRARSEFRDISSLSTTWLFEPILRAFVITSNESAPLDDFFRSLDEVLLHPKAHHQMRVLIDNTRVPAPTSEIIREGLNRLVRYVPRLEQAAIVLVVPGAGDHGIGRMAELMLDDRLQIEVFNDMATAVLSLTMDEMH